MLAYGGLFGLARGVGGGRGNTTQPPYIVVYGTNHQHDMLLEPACHHTSRPKAALCVRRAAHCVWAALWRHTEAGNLADRGDACVGGTPWRFAS